MSVQSGVARDKEQDSRTSRSGIDAGRDEFQSAIDKSLESRPHTTLMLAVGLGFLLGVFWTR
jgi:hypothetical protein